MKKNRVCLSPGLDTDSPKTSKILAFSIYVNAQFHISQKLMASISLSVFYTAASDLQKKSSN